MNLHLSNEALDEIIFKHNGAKRMPYYRKPGGKQPQGKPFQAAQWDALAGRWLVTGEPAR